MKRVTNVLYARERFLARLTASPHHRRLILKGAAVFALWLDVHRPTRDLDFLGIGDFGPEQAIGVVRDIIAVAMDDGLPGFPPPRVKVYPPETIVSEKLHAIVKLGIANSRMKDFFDLWLLASRREFDTELLAKAVVRTFRRRKTAIPEEAFALTEEFYSDREKQTQWRAFLRKSGVDAPTDFATVGRLLRRFLVPLLDAARGTKA